MLWTFNIIPAVILRKTDVQTAWQILGRDWLTELLTQDWIHYAQFDSDRTREVEKQQPDIFQDNLLACTEHGLDVTTFNVKKMS